MNTRVTVHPTAVRLRQLDESGEPVGPWITVPVESFTVTLTTDNPKENTVPRETLASLRAERDAAQSAADHYRQAAVAAERKQTTAEVELSDLDPEARALAEIVAVIVRMRERMAQAAGRSNMNTTAAYAAQRDWEPEATRTPEGRLLLALAARYSVPLGPLDPPAPPTLEDEGQSLVIAPSPLARALDQLIGEHYGDLGRIRPR